MAYVYTISNVSNNITVTQGGDNINVSQTSTQVTINPNATIIQTKNTADTYRGQWTSGTQYYRGDTVTYGNILYLAKADVQSTTNPTADTTNWTQYVVATSTSTFVRLTATNAIVAKAQAVFAFEDNANLTQSTIALNTSNYNVLEIDAPNGGVRVVGSGIFRAGAGTFDTGLQVGSANTPGQNVYFDNHGDATFNYNHPTQGTLTLLALSINTATGVGVVSGDDISITGHQTIFLDTDFNQGDIRLNGTTRIYPSGGAQWNYNSGGFYAGSVKVIDNNGNWVGPAITDSPQESVTGITGTTQVQVDNFDKTVYDTAKYLIKAKDGNDLHIVEMLLAFDGSDIHKSEYGVITNNGLLGTFSADVVGNNIRLLFTPNGATNMTIRIERTFMAV